MEYSSDKSNNNISIPQFPYKQTNSKQLQSIIYWHKNFWFDFVRQGCPTLILILLTARVCRHTRTSWIAKVANNLNWIALLKNTIDLLMKWVWLCNHLPYFSTIFPLIIYHNLISDSQFVSLLLIKLLSMNIFLLFQE